MEYAPLEANSEQRANRTMDGDQTSPDQPKFAVPPK